MQKPLEVTFRDVERTPGVEALIEERVEKLEEFCDHITGCRLAVERPHKHESSGNPYRVRIDVTIPPGHDLIVTKDPRDNELDDPLDRVLLDAFKAMERQVKELVDRQSGELKTHHEPRGLVVRLFDGYGFIKAADDGHEIYFHENSVAERDFDRLEVGTEVRYMEREGEKGPQASTVQIVNKPGSRSTEDEEVSPPPGWQK